MKTDSPKLFKNSKNPAFENKVPVYTINDGHFFRTINHPKGWTEHPDYSLGSDGKLYRTKHHWLGYSNLPDYEFRGNRQLYRTEHHPEGHSDIPEYEIKD